MAQRRRTTQSTTPQPVGNHNTQKVDPRDTRAGQERKKAIKHSARVYMPANPLPLDFPFRLGQRRRRKPPDAKAQRQRIPNN